MTRSKSFIDELKASFDVGSNEDLTLVPPDYEKREFISKSPLINYYYSDQKWCNIKVT